MQETELLIQVRVPFSLSEPLVDQGEGAIEVCHGFPFFLLNQLLARSK